MKYMLLCALALVAVQVVRARNTVCGDMVAMQSTTGIWSNHAAQARLAIDGNTNQDWYKGKSCTHTAPNDADPWLSIDMGCVKTVKMVRIYNRMDAGVERLNNFQLVLTDDPYCTRNRCSGTVCAYHEGKCQCHAQWCDYRTGECECSFKGVKNIVCEGKGRFLTLRYKEPEKQPEKHRFIHVCEIMITAE